MERQLKRWWTRVRGQEPTPAQLQAVEDWCGRALEGLRAYPGPEELLVQRRIRLYLSQEPHRVAGLRWRARLDLQAGSLTLYAGALDELQARLPDRALLSRTFMIHEIFHLLCPDCPRSLQEASAHLFTARVCRLDDFPGLWDLDESP